MEKINFDFQLPKEANKIIVLSLIFLLSLLIFIFLIIVPNQYRIKKIDLKTTEIKNIIEKQKILSPLYNHLKNKKNPSEFNGIKITKKGKLSKKDISNISQIISKIVKESRLSLEWCIPDIKTLNNSSGLLKIDMLVSGKFSRFRDFLISLCETSFLEKIESIEINSSTGYKKYSITYWIALDK